MLHSIKLMFLFSLYEQAAANVSRIRKFLFLLFYQNRFRLSHNTSSSLFPPVIEKIRIKNETILHGEASHTLPSYSVFSPGFPPRFVDSR